MNKVILMGRLTQDPELSQTPSGVNVARFSIAVPRRFSKDQTDFINCTVWRQQAEFICKYFRKGSMIAVVGSIQTRSWDGQDGKKRYATDVVVDEAYFTGSKAETGTAGAPAADFGGYSQPAPKPNNSMEPNFDEFEDMGFSAMDTGADDDLPF